MPLSAFTPLVRDWFADAFAEPTPAQVQAWPAIATGENVLISAPTGSGKTLAAGFVFAFGQQFDAHLHRFGEARVHAHEIAREDAGFVAAGATDEHRTRLLYVSPLKALSYDVERNLRAPLRGLGLGDQVRVAIRTGDTPARERAAMLRHAPDILITTPESLYLMLTSQAREILTGVAAVILDEIHAVADELHALAENKRGALLMATAERLQEVGTGPLVRIGLSATQRPLEEVARFMVGPTRRATIIDVGATRPLDLEIRVPVESMVEPDQGAQRDPLEPVIGGEATRRSIWPAIYPQLLDLVRTHRSTIVFVNSRRAAERLALRLNELAAADGDAPAPGEAAPAEIARAHHGSLAAPQRAGWD